MSEEQFQEATEQATPKRLEKARDEGQIPRSKEWNTAAIMLASALGMWVLGEQLVIDLRTLFNEGLVLTRENMTDNKFILKQLAVISGQALSAVTPFLLLTAVVAVAAPGAIGGWSFSTEAMSFKWSRINPASGLKRVFGLTGLLELVKSLLKFLLVGTLSVWVLWHYSHEIMSIGREDLTTGLGHSGYLFVKLFLLLSLSLLILALIDVPYQLWDHARKLKMTKQQVRDEHKETEGSPELKGRIRGLQQEMSRQRLVEAVPAADVVITNPTHYAVALRYDPEQAHAPVVVAKGRDLIAAQIRSIAQSNGVPLFAAPPLARAIYRHTAINDAVPAALYMAIAQVLAYVYQVDAAQQAGELPPTPPIPNVPAELVPLK